jgi:aspartyl-tRNA(Asn)/glutamyl-tRNA(Gln) amidotransferase subunit B
MPYSVVIGLEVHTQLKTRTKLFCGCEIVTGDDANLHTCPVCLGMPGTLPSPNAQAVELAIRLGLAMGCTIDRHAMFTRKSYFYPDSPRNYQITQTGGMPIYDRPLCTGGGLHIKEGAIDKFVSLTRIHMEDDAGKLLHDRGPWSVFDANRAGTPLCEIVSAPDLRSVQEAVLYLQRLKQLVEYIGVSDANMEDGNFRADVNVSLRRDEDSPLGVRCELKNMNSFSNIEKAVQYEIARQAEILDNGGHVVQETRGFDVNRGVTRNLRDKEDAHDYRYFPEPDILPLAITDAQIEGIRAAMPELPEARVARFQQALGLPEYDARVLTLEKSWADWFEAAVALRNSPKAVSNWVMTDVLRLVKETGKAIEALPFGPSHLAQLVERIEDGTISGKIAKDVFALMSESGKMPDALIEEHGMRQVTDTGAIDAAVARIVAANPAEVEAYRGGKEKLFGFFVGQVMKATGGSANPKLVNEVLRRLL